MSAFANEILGSLKLLDRKIMNGIYLNLLRHEIENELSGRYIDEIRIRQRLLQIILGRKALFVSLYPDLLAVYLSERWKKGFEKLEKFSEPIRSSRIKKIEQCGFLPVLKLILEKNDTELVFSLYRKAPNFILKTSRFQRKLYSRHIDEPPKRSLFDATEKELKHNYVEQSQRFADFLLNEFEGLDKNLSAELTPARISCLKKILSSGEVKPRVVSVNPFRMSLFAEDYSNEYESFNQLFEDSFKKFMTIKDNELIALRKNRRIKTIKRQMMRLQKKMLSDDEVESYRVKGNLILTNISRIKIGSQKFRTRDIYNDQMIVIALDPQMTAQANAQHYFSEYKKLKRGIPRIKEKIEQLRMEIREIKSPDFRLPEVHKTQREKAKKTEPFRIFELPSGSIVYVGKRARSNYELTFAFARPSDYFFHIRNYEGAHVILRAKIPRGQRPNKKDLEAAASIAAYFSKAKTQKNVPVSYSQRKYLKKNKKGKPGSVILMREDVVFVDPGLPVGKTE